MNKAIRFILLFVTFIVISFVASYSVHAQSYSNWNTTTSLPTATRSATSVVYNGYVYEIGGYNGSAIAAVEYAPINSNGTLGSWSATTSLPTATYGATSVVYNGYVYEIGGCSSICPTTTVEYAPINSNGTLGSWSATTSLPQTTYSAASVVYNGYVYEIGGYTGIAIVATVEYAPINSNGTVGSWSATTSLPISTFYAASMVYNGYLYEIGGELTTTVEYALINSNGTIGSWTATTSLPIATYNATSEVYNGYVYEIGGYTGTSVVATVEYAPINSDGTIGSWIATTSLPQATYIATSVIYNGYVYEIGGYNSSTLNTVYYANVDLGRLQGYTIAGSNGNLFYFGTTNYGDMGNVPSNVPTKQTVGFAQTPGDLGYYILTQDGGVYTFGNAGFYGSVYNIPNAPVKTPVAIATTPNGGGYYILTQDGGVYTFGNAQFYGSLYNIPSSAIPDRVPVAFGVTPSGNGYYIVTQNGAVYTFGDAQFQGSTYNIPNAPVKTTVAFSLTPNGNGYYLITKDGGVYTFGTAQFQGSMYNISNPPVRTPVAFQLTPNGQGYYIITQDGGVYTFGNAIFLGSVAGLNVIPVSVQ